MGNINNFLKLPSFTRRGDTIVEVMVSIAVVMTVLAGGYALARNSLDDSVDLAKRSQAIAINRGQVEYIRNAFQNNLATLISYQDSTTYANGFCILNGGAASKFDGQDSPCTKFDGSDDGSDDSPYSIKVTYDKDKKLFTVLALWPKRADTQNQATLFYKLPDAASTITQGTFNIGVNPSSLSIKKGTSGTTSVKVTPENGFNANVLLAASGPEGASYSFAPSTIIGGSGCSTLTITIDGQATAGTYTVTIKGKSGDIEKQTTLSLTITQDTPPPTLVDVDINSAEGFAPRSVRLKARVNPNGYSLTECYFKNGLTPSFEWGKTPKEGKGRTTCCYQPTPPHENGDCGSGNDWRNSTAISFLNVNLSVGLDNGQAPHLKSKEKLYYQFCATNAGGTACSVNCYVIMNSSDKKDGKWWCDAPDHRHAAELGCIP